MNCELKKCVHARVCCLQEDFFEAARKIYGKQPFPKRKVDGAIPALLEWVYTYCQERSQPAESEKEACKKDILEDSTQICPKCHRQMAVMSGSNGFSGGVCIHCE